MTAGTPNPTEERIKAHMLEAMVEAAMQNHDISSWEEGETPDTYYATCENCGRSVYVSPTSIRSLMASRCPVRGTVPKIVSNLRAAAHLGDRPRFEEAFHTLLAHYSDYTFRQIAADPEHLIPKAWESLPEEQRRRVNQLRRLLDENEAG